MSLLRVAELESQLARRDAYIAELEAKLAPILFKLDHEDCESSYGDKDIALSNAKELGCSVLGYAYVGIVTQ